MKDRLKKNMYFRIGREKPSKLFDVVYGSFISDSLVFVKNAGWYNKKGERLGFGDLAQFQIEKMKKELLPGELFIILCQEDSWESTIEEARKRNPKKIGENDAPGPLYVASRAWIIVASGVVYEVKSSDIFLGGEGMRNGIRTKIISRVEAVDLILKNKKPPQ